LIGSVLVGFGVCQHAQTESIETRCDLMFADRMPRGESKLEGDGMKSMTPITSGNRPRTHPVIRL